MDIVTGSIDKRQLERIITRYNGQLLGTKSVNVYAAVGLLQLSVSLIEELLASYSCIPVAK